MYQSEKMFTIEEDFEYEEDWEKGILDSYRLALSYKINWFCGTLERIESEFKNTYPRAPEKIEKEEIREEDIVRWRILLVNALEDFYGWGSVSLSDFEQMLKGLSSKGKLWIKRKLRQGINWLLNKFIPFIKKFKPLLRVQGWSVGASGGFPFGISIGISVAFEP